MLYERCKSIRIEKKNVERDFPFQAWYQQNRNASEMLFKEFLNELYGFSFVFDVDSSSTRDGLQALNNKHCLLKVLKIVLILYLYVAIKRRRV